MCSSTVANAVPESSMWHGAISVEDAQLVRLRHAEKVEEWLDEAEFCTELFKLHEKYGIDLGEEGYAAYRDYLRASYYQKLQTYGPTPNPLDEGCDCFFCKMHSEEPDAEVEQKPEPRRVRCADQPTEQLSPEISPHSGPYTDTKEPSTDRECEVTDKKVVRSTASGKCELPEVTSNGQATHVPRSRVVNQDPSEIGPHSGPYLDSEQRDDRERREKKLGPAPAYEYDDYEEAPDDTSRYDSVGGVEPNWGEKKDNSQPTSTRVYPPPHLPGRLPARVPPDSKWPDDRERQNKEPAPPPGYVKTAGEREWLRKMSGTIF